MKSASIPNFFISQLSTWFNGVFRASHASLIRILVYTTAFYYYLNYSNIGYSRLDSEFWNPTGFAHLLNFMAPPLPIFSILEKIWLISLFTSMTGLLSKLSKIVAFLGFVLVGAYDQHFGFLTFTGVPLISMLLFLIFLNDDYYSLDRLWSKKKIYPYVVEVWPVLCFQIFQLFLYFGSAIQKLRSDTRSWHHGTTIHHFFSNHLQQPLLSYFLICAATFTLIIELTCPLMFSKRWVYLYMGSFLIFHLVSAYFLHVDISPFWIVGIVTFYFSSKAIRS